MIELLCALASVPIDLMTNLPRAARFARWKPAHGALRSDDAGVWVDDELVPWSRLAPGRWIVQDIRRLAANHDAAAIVALALVDGGERVVGPLLLEGDAAAATRALVDRGLLPEAPEDGGWTRP